jgi:hypothetical protein
LERVGRPVAARVTFRKGSRSACATRAGVGGKSGHAAVGQCQKTQIQPNAGINLEQPHEISATDGVRLSSCVDNRVIRDDNLIGQDNRSIAGEGNKPASGHGGAKIRVIADADVAGALQIVLEQQAADYCSQLEGNESSCVCLPLH